MIVRCKRRKIPGDGGVVDGCGWQGYAPLIHWSSGLFQCPSCGSWLLREVERNSMKPGYEPKYLLGEMGQICEEAGEVMKHFGKILRFGLDNAYYPHETNRDAFYRELDDLEACIKRIKARHATNPSEALGPIPDAQVTPYVKLAEAAQEYLEVLSEAKVELITEGVTRRGRLREAYTKLNALVGVALGNTQA